MVRDDRLRFLRFGRNDTFAIPRMGVSIVLPDSLTRRAGPRSGTHGGARWWVRTPSTTPSRQTHPLFRRAGATRYHTFPLSSWTRLQISLSQRRPLQNPLSWRERVGVRAQSTTSYLDTSAYRRNMAIPHALPSSPRTPMRGGLGVDATHRCRRGWTDRAPSTATVNGPSKRGPMGMRNGIPRNGPKGHPTRFRQNLNSYRVEVVMGE